MKTEQVICTTEPVASCESKNEENGITKCEEAKDFNEKLNYKPNPKKGVVDFKNAVFMVALQQPMTLIYNGARLLNNLSILK